MAQTNIISPELPDSFSDEEMAGLADSFSDEEMQALLGSQAPAAPPLGTLGKGFESLITGAKGLGRYALKSGKELIDQPSFGYAEGIQSLGELIGLEGINPLGKGVEPYDPETLIGKTSRLVSNLAAGGFAGKGLAAGAGGLKLAKGIGIPLIKAETKVKGVLSAANKWITNTMGKGMSEKTLNYVAGNPETVLKPETLVTGLDDAGVVIGKEASKKVNYPSLWQQTYNQAFDSFNAIKKEAGENVGEFRKFARAAKSPLRTTVKDLADEIDGIIASGVYGDETGNAGVTLLRDVKNKLVFAGHKGTVKAGKKAKLAADELDFNELEKVYNGIVESKIYQNATNTFGKTLTGGEQKAVDISFKVKDRLFKMVDDIAADAAYRGSDVVRDQYKLAMDIARQGGSNSPQDLGVLLAKSLAHGEEELFDLLQKTLPKEIFDKSVASLLNMPKEQIQNILVGFGGQGLNVYGIEHLSPSRLAGPVKKFVAGRKGVQAPFEVTSGTKRLIKLGRDSKNLQEFIKKSGLSKGAARNVYNSIYED